MKKDKLDKKVDRIAVEVVKQMEAIKDLVTRDEFNQKMDRVLDGQDKMMAILQRLDTEMARMYDNGRKGILGRE